MKSHRIEVIWQNEVVGYIEDPRFDMWHVYGRWFPETGCTAEQFLSVLGTAMAVWDEYAAGVDVHFGKDRTPGEVTGLSDGEINLKMMS